MGGFKGLGSLIRQDMSVAYRNGFLWVAVGMAAIFIAIVNWVIPEKVQTTAGEYVVDKTEGRVIAAYLEGLGRGDAILPSEERLLEVLEGDSRALGLVFTGTRDAPGAVVYLQGYEPEKSVRALDAAVESLWNEAAGLGRPSVHQAVLLRAEVLKPPFNKSLVPVLLVTEVVFLGFIFASVMVLQEKAEGSVKAYRVSPSGTWAYILSKTIVNVALSSFYGLLIYSGTLGIGLAIIPVLALVVLTSALVTMAGLATSVFFNSISDFIYPLVVSSLVLALPVGAYLFPSFRLPGFEVIPSYPLMFGIREIAFPTAKSGFYLSLVATLLLEVLVVLLLCGWAVEKRLMKEGH
ncbi:MAG: hypothetical protein AB1576_04680 [Bacillota bacterium]